MSAKGEWATETILNSMTDDQIWSLIWIYWGVTKTDKIAVRPGWRSLVCLHMIG